MSVLHRYYPTWESLVEDIKEDNNFDPMHFPGDDYSDHWVLDNEFYRDKHGKLVENWIFTLRWEEEENGYKRGYYEKIPSTRRGYPTLEEALTVKLFEGESIKDLYDRKYDWLDYSEEWYTDENGERIPRKSELTPR